jgi:tetratricopeptide (TPR) repeat protein
LYPFFHSLKLKPFKLEVLKPETCKREIQQRRILFAITLIVLNLSCSFTAKAQEKLQDYDYWASLCTSLGKSKKFKEAVVACDQAITINPNEPIAWAERGHSLVALAMYTEAVVSYDRFIRLDPINSEILTKRCGALNEIERYDDALTSCESALRIDKNWGETSPAEAWYNQATTLKRSGKPAESLESLALAIRTKPNYSIALADRCDLLSSLDRNPEALKDCEKAIKVNANWRTDSTQIRTL